MLTAKVMVSNSLEIQQASPLLHSGTESTCSYNPQPKAPVRKQMHQSQTSSIIEWQHVVQLVCASTNKQIAYVSSRSRNSIL